MLTVLVAGTAAAAAIFGQLFSSLNFPTESGLIIEPESIPLHPLAPEILPQADKQIDAFFVSHGMAEVPVEKQVIEEVDEPVAEEVQVAKEKPVHEILQLSQIQPGENWLIFSYVPWCPVSLATLEHFKSHYTQVVNDGLKLGIVDADAHPEMVYHLQSRQYPSFVLVTEDLRLRPWPFVGHRMNSEILAFLEHSQWRYLPVFQRLMRTEPHPWYLLQLRIFNKIALQLTMLQPQIISFIQQNRQLTGTAMAIFGISALAFKKQLY